MTRPSRNVEHPNPQAASCLGKEIFASWTAADRVIKRKQAAQRTRGDQIVAFTIYACQRCGGFHIAGAA